MVEVFSKAWSAVRSESIVVIFYSEMPSRNCSWLERVLAELVAVAVASGMIGDTSVDHGVARANMGEKTSSLSNPLMRAGCVVVLSRRGQDLPDLAWVSWA